jgi:GH24 family phage-related lysozyme (muramidase)
MGYAFFGGAAEGLSDSIDRIGAMVDRRVEMEQGIEAVKLSNELNVAYEQSWAKAQEEDPLDGNFVQRQSQSFDTLKSQYLNNIKNKNVRLKFEALATKDKGNYMSKSALWETEAKRVRIKQDAMDIESVSSGYVSNIAENTGDIAATLAEVDVQVGRMTASYSGLPAEEQIKAVQQVKDKFVLSGVDGITRKIQNDYVTGDIDEETVAKRFDELGDTINSPEFIGSTELRQRLIDQVSAKKITALNQLKAYNDGVIEKRFKSYLDLAAKGEAVEDPNLLNRALKLGKTAEQKEEIQREYNIALEKGKAATSVLNGDIGSVSDTVTDLNRRAETASSAGNYEEAQKLLEAASAIQQGGTAMIKAIKEDPAGTAIANDAILQQAYQEGDKEKFFRGLVTKFGMMTPANKLMPIPAAEKARLVSTLVNGSPDEVGRAIKGLESWNIKTDLLKDDTTPMDIIINEISKDVIKQTEKTGDRSALALLWYGDNDLKRGTLMKYLKTPISADNSSLKKEEVNKAIEKVIKPYVLGFEKQADLAGGAGNWIVANKDIVRGLAYQIAELNPSMKGKASEAVAEAMRLTIQDKYVTQNKGSNSVTIQKEYASEGYLSFLGDKNKQTSYALSNLFGKKTWEGIHTASQRGDEFGGFGKFIKDDVMKNLKLEATKRGINTDNLDLENIGVADSFKPKTVKDLNFITTQEGFSNKAYPDGSQYSIGFGTKANTPDEVISKEEAQTRFTQRVNQDVAFVNRLQAERVSRTGKGLSQKQFDSLVSFFYNAGQGVNSVKDLVITGNDEAVMKKMREFNKAEKDGVLAVSTGLVSRREKETKLYGEGAKELDAVVKLTPEQEKLVNLREEVTSRIIETAIRDKGTFRPVGNTGRARLYVNYMIPGLSVTKAYPLPIGRESGNFKYFEVDAKTAGSYVPPPKIDKTTVGAVQNATKVLEMFQGW